MGKTFKNSIKTKTTYIVPSSKIDHKELICRCGAGVMRNEWHRMRGKDVIFCPACAYDH